MSKTPVNKAQLIEIMAKEANISKASATLALSAFLNAIVSSLSKGESVPLLGFGSFTVKARAARSGRNPKTGELIEILAANIVSFKAGKTLKDAVNSRSVELEEEAALAE